jgi:hypothetical protein
MQRGNEKEVENFCSLASKLTFFLVYLLAKPTNAYFKAMKPKADYIDAK